MEHRCRRCHRQLKNEKAQCVGIGKTCADKLKNEKMNQYKLQFNRFGVCHG